MTAVSNPALTGSETGIAVTPAPLSALVLSTFPATTAGVAQTFTVAAEDAFGNVIPGYTGTVHFTSTDPQAVLPPDTTFTAADAGVHTFTATLKTAGTRSLTAQDTVTAALTSSQPAITVSPGAVAGFTVTGFPATTAGAAQSFTVTARDAFGNVTTGYAGTLSFSSSDPQASLPASYTFTAADAGVHTFSATLKTAGTQSLSVKDAANSAIQGSQSGIAVNAGAASKIVFTTLPATFTQGVGTKFTVTVFDAYGNVATGYRGKVHLSSTDSEGRDVGLHLQQQRQWRAYVQLFVPHARDTDDHDSGHDERLDPGHRRRESGVEVKGFAGRRCRRRVPGT